MLVAKEWGVRPAEVMQWGVDEFGLALAYLERAAELRNPTEES